MKHKPYVLVARQLGGIGDVLMLSCVFRGLREKYPQHTLKVVTAQVYLSGALMDVMTHNPYIDEVHPIEPWDMTPERTRLVWANYYRDSGHLEDGLFWKMADFAVDLNTACVDYEWEALKNGNIERPRWEIWCAAAGVKPSSYAPVYRIAERELAQAKAFVRASWGDDQLVGLGLSACDKRRAIGIGKLKAVCAGLRERGFTPVTIDPTNRFEGVEGIVGKRVSELMPIIALMSCVVSVDSGILHMAGTVGTPVVGLFGPTDYRMRMGHYLGSATDSTRLVDCAPCWYNYPCVNGRGVARKVFECLEKISPEVIVEETSRWAKYRSMSGQ